MIKTFNITRTAVIAGVLAATGLQAKADIAIDASITFDNVASGSTANAALGSWVSAMRFANPDIEADVDQFGSETGTFHWIDATAAYGDVQVLASSAAVSGANVLSNSLQPIMLKFSAPVDIASFSIRQDLSGFGNPQAGGSYLAFLDSTGHEISGTRVSYTQYGAPGFSIEGHGIQAVSAVLLSGGVNYDDMRVITAAAAVPEPASMVLLGFGLAAGVAAARGRTKSTQGQ